MKQLMAGIVMTFGYANYVASKSAKQKVTNTKYKVREKNRLANIGE